MCVGGERGGAGHLGSMRRLDAMTACPCLFSRVLTFATFQAYQAPGKLISHLQRNRLPTKLSLSGTIVELDRLDAMQ